jgi:hypothetical protein
MGLEESAADGVVQQVFLIAYRSQDGSSGDRL